MGDRDFGLDSNTVERIAAEIRHVHEMNVQICLVIGGGNFFRGISSAASAIERTSADYMGMLATVMNALAMQSFIEKQGIHARVLSAIPMSTFCEPFVRRRAIRHLQKGRVVIFAAGTGNPFFTTDTAAALRAAEMDCEALLKGTQVDGVYSDDPKTVKDAERFDRLTYQDALTRNLRIMDASAIALARDNKVPILVFSLHNPGTFAEVVTGSGIYTVIS